MDPDRSPTLARIRRAGVMRVGTTGDYAPFSLRQADGSHAGADIDMAHDLAGRLGVAIWPMMRQSLTSGFPPDPPGRLRDYARGQVLS